MELLENFDVTISINDVLRGEGADPEVVQMKKPTMAKTAELALHEGFSLLHPIAVLSTLNIIEHHHETILLEGNQKLTGRLVSHHFSGAIQIAAVVCTIGVELENRIRNIIGNDAAYALALDGVGNAAVEKLAQQVCGRIGDRVQSCGMTTSTPLSPGEPEWPVEIGQPQIFSLLELSRTQVSLTSGGMMVPKKSMSFVVGIGLQMAQTEPCQQCNLRERCHFRHA